MHIDEKIKHFRSIKGKRVIVSIGINDAPRGTMIYEVSPNGLFVHLISSYARDESIGWVNIHDICLLDIFE